MSSPPPPPPPELRRLKVPESFYHGYPVFRVELERAGSFGWYWVVKRQTRPNGPWFSATGRVGVGIGDKGFAWTQEIARRQAQRFLTKYLRKQTRQAQDPVTFDLHTS